MSARVDWPRLILALDLAQELRDGLSDHDAAEQIGIAPSGICRLRAGKALSADGLAKLLAWLYPASRPTWIAVDAAPREQEGPFLAADGEIHGTTWLDKAERASLLAAHQKFGGAA